MKKCLSLLLVVLAGVLGTAQLSMAALAATDFAGVTTSLTSGVADMTVAALVLIGGFAGVMVLHMLLGMFRPRK